MTDILNRLADWLGKNLSDKADSISSPAASPLPVAGSTLVDMDFQGELHPKITLKSLELEPPLPAISPGPHKYHIVDRLGEGGMGEVYLVYDQDLRRRLALKTVRTSSRELAARFFNEAQVMGQLAHPNIVTVHELGLTEEHRPYYTMPLVQGKTLGEILQDLGDKDPESLRSFSLTRLVQIFLQLVLAVDYAHAKGVVHRDIKPTNVMIGEHGEVMLLDWGVAKVLGDGGVETDLAEENLELQALGTPAYMAPEQILEKPIDARTDVYALGVLLYELLTRVLPFEGGVEDVMRAHLARNPIPPRARAPELEIPLELELTCLKALQKKPEERHPTARGLHDEVQAWLEAASDKAKRRERAGELAAQGRKLLDSYRSLKEKIFDLEADVGRLQAMFKSWQTVEEKAPLHQAEDRVVMARRNLGQIASDLVMTLSAALGHDGEHRTARRTMAAYYRDRFVEAEAVGDLEGRDYFGKLVAAFHDGHYERELKGDGSLQLDSNPRGAEVWLQELVEEKLVLVPRHSKCLGTTPLGPIPLPMGSYLVTLKKEGFPEIRYPICISRNRDWQGQVHMYTQNQIGEGYCFIPAGPFTLGGDVEVRGWCLPRSDRVLGDFFITTHPVTMAEYLEYLNELAVDHPDEAIIRSPRRSPDGGSYLQLTKGRRWELPKEEARTTHWSLDTPVVAISWHDAVAYCSWRSVKERCEVRLPTDEEWEKSSRGVDGRWFPWGNRFDASLCNMKSTRREGAAPLPVGSYLTDTSVFGVRDTAGNVRDWTATSLSDGEGMEGDTRVIRGGAWNLPAIISRSANRFWLSPSFVLNYVGFRVARSVPVRPR
jgi:serine/threonine-protein kinase